MSLPRHVQYRDVYVPPPENASLNPNNEWAAKLSSAICAIVPLMVTSSLSFTPI